MATTAPTAERQHGHGIDISDLDLDGVPGTHRHAIRALRSRLESTTSVNIDHVTATGRDTVIFMDRDRSGHGTLSTNDVRRALDDTGVETAEIRIGDHFSVKLDYYLGFEV